MSELRRELRMVDGAALAVGSMVGAGIFITPNMVARELPSGAWILAAWIFAGVVSMCGALAFAELGAMLPGAGGQYVYLREAYGPGVAFLSGWSALVTSHTGTLAWLAASFALYLGQFVTLPETPARLVGLALIASLTVVNCLGVRAGARVQNALTVLKLAGLAGIGMAALLAPKVETPVATAPVTAGAFGVALIACLLSYDGWSNVGLVAGEMRDPQRTIPRALLLGMGVVIAAYVAVNAAYLRVMTPAEMAATDRVGALAVERSMGTAGGGLMAALILLSTAGTCNGWMMASPRLYYAMARDGLFFRSMGDVHPLYGTPVRAIVVQGLLSSLLVVTGTYESLLSYMMAALFTFYLLAVVGVMVLRRKRPGAARPYRMWGYPVTPLLFAVVAAGFVLNMLVEETGPSLASLGLAAAGLPAYWWWRRQG